MPPITPPRDHKGQPTVILAKTVKGYGMGEAGEGQNITHQQKKMGEAALAQFRDRFQMPICRTSSSRRCRSSASPRAARRCEYLRERRAGARRLPAGAPAQVASRSGAAALRLRGAAQGHRGPRDLDHHGVRAHPEHAAARQDDRQARRADRARRKPHLRHGGHVPPVRHLQPGRPALPAAGCRPAHVLQGGQDRPDAPGGHQRGRAPCPPGSRRRRPTRRRTRR